MLKSRHSLIAAILILYFIPIFVMGSYSLRWLSVEQSWNMLSLSILLASCGSIVICGFLYLWQAERAEPLPIQEDPPVQVEDQELLGLKEDLEHFRKLSEALDKEKLSIQDSFEEQLLEKNRLLAEQTHTIEALTHDLQTSQQKAEELEIKVNDLNYEIKTLLQLSVIEEEPLKEEPFEELESLPEPAIKTIHTSQEASMQLKRCLDIAQKITGYQNYDGRFTGSNFALDQRHLFDNLRSEHSATILFYSKKEEKLLFASNQIKSLLGWSPDKLIQDFKEITLEGSEEWKNATLAKETNLSLKMKTKSGEAMEVKALVGAIPSGVFRQDLIAILWH